MDANDNPRIIRRVTGTRYYYTAPTTPTWRYVGTFSFDLNSDHQQYGKVWQHTISMGDASIPFTMKASAA